MMLSARALLIAALVTSGCGGDLHSSPGSRGMLRQGAFYYCDDSQCDDCLNSFHSYLWGAFPGGIGVGATFTARYNPDDHAGSVNVESPLPDRLEPLDTVIDRTKFRALHAGKATLYARSEAQHRLVDALEIDLFDVVALNVQPGSLPADGGAPDIITIGLNASSPTSLCATALDTSGEHIAGVFPWVWSSSDNAVVWVDESSSEANCSTLSPLSVGSATITASIGAVSGSVTVQVSS